MELTLCATFLTAQMGVIVQLSGNCVPSAETYEYGGNKCVIDSSWNVGLHI